MAISKMCTWVYISKLKDTTGADPADSIYLAMKFAVYADLADAEAIPYLRLENCDLFSRSRSAVAERVSALLQIQIDDEETIYNFSTGSSIRQIDILEYSMSEGGGAPYATRFSSSTNIIINNTGTAFVMKLSVKMRNNETYELSLPACGIVPQVVTGDTELMTGEVYTYTFSTPLTNIGGSGDRYNFAAWLAYAQEIQKWADGHTEPYYWKSSDAFLAPYDLARRSTDPVSQVSFVAYNYAGHQYGTQNGGLVCLDYYYIPASTQTHHTNVGGIESYTVLVSETAANRYIYADARDKGICISSVRKAITVSNKSSVNDSLRPVFKNFTHSAYPPDGANTYHQYANVYDMMIAKYNGIVQGTRYGYIIANFDADENYAKYRQRGISGEALQYDDRFTTGTIVDSVSGTSRTTSLDANMNLAGGNVTSLSYIKAACAIGVFDTPGANKTVTFSLRDSFEFTTTVTEHVTVLPYHRPGMPVCTAERCSVATGDEEELYPYDGVTYTPDESGYYALVKWEIDVSALNNCNSHTLRVRLRDSDEWQVIEVNSYTDSGYLVFPVVSDSSYNIHFELSDDFYSKLSFVAPLNTVYAMLDFKRGGVGVAMGKVSELDYVYDIHRNWILKMPYYTHVLNYNSDGTYVNLYDWMQQVDRRIEAIANSRDVGVFARWAVADASRWYNGNATVCVPDAYGQIVEENKLYTNYGSSTDIRTAGWMNRDPITVTRPYLNITLGTVYSYSGNTATREIVYRPTVYILTSKPTTINQSTGAPNGTIIRQQAYTMASTSFEGYIGDRNTYVLGYYTWYSRYPGGSITNSYSFDLSAYQGQDIYILVTATCGYCPGLEWRMTRGYVYIENIWQSNTRV